MEMTLTTDCICYTRHDVPCLSYDINANGLLWAVQKWKFFDADMN